MLLTEITECHSVVIYLFFFNLKKSWGVGEGGGRGGGGGSQLNN